MRRSFFQPKPTKTLSQLLGIVAIYFTIIPVSLEATPADCQAALPLSLQQANPGYAKAKQRQIHSIIVDEPGILVIEAHGLRASVGPGVRFLGQKCQASASNLPIRAVRGRHLHQVVPGTYFVEISTDGLGRGSYRVDTWLNPTPQHWTRLATKEEMDESDEFGNCMPPRDRTDGFDKLTGLPMKEEMDESDEFGNCLPVKEEMDESDELTFLPTKEEMDESDEFDGNEPPVWLEVEGLGLLEIVSQANSLETRIHPLCPWLRRPSLLATFTCAPRIPGAAHETIIVASATPGTPRLIAITLPRAGQLAIENIDAPSARATVFDADGKLITELNNSESDWIEAGAYFVKTSPTHGSIRLYAELD